MNGRTIGVLAAAAAVGLAGGYVVVQGWVPWVVPLAALGVACAIGVFMIRERVGHTVAASGRAVRTSGQAVAASGRAVAARGRSVAVSGRTAATNAARRLRGRQQSL